MRRLRGREPTLLVPESLVASHGTWMVVFLLSHPCMSDAMSPNARVSMSPGLHLLQLSSPALPPFAHACNPRHASYLGSMAWSMYNQFPSIARFPWKGRVVPLVQRSVFLVWFWVRGIDRESDVLHCLVSPFK